MCLEKKRHHRDADRVRRRSGAEKGVDAFSDWRVETRLQCAALRGIRKHLRRNAPPLGRIGNQLVRNVVGVDGLDSEFIEIASRQRLAAGDSACQGDALHLAIVSR